MPPVKRNQAPANLWQSIKPHRSVRHFENTVIQFNYLHKTPIRQLPFVLGKKINLRKLYISVIKRGGYKKVNEKEVWEEILSDLNLPREGTNCELAIQTIYHRYLEAYERDQWNRLNSNVDNNANMCITDIDLSKHTAYISELTIRDRSYLASFVHENTPKIYSDYRHIVSNTVRWASGLSCDLKEASELRHLTMSLKSGLCNEIDFALNTLLIMSNNNQISVDLRFTGELIDLVIASTGIVDIRPGSYFEQFKNCLWLKDSLKFWNRTVKDGVGRIFLVPNIFTCTKSDVKQIQRDCNRTSCNGNDELFNDDNRYHKIVDPCCARIHLVATFIQNLTIDSPVNSQALISNNQALRFLFLSIHSRDSVLRRIALQTLTKLRFVLFPIQDSSDTGLRSLLYSSDDCVNIDRSSDKEEDSEEEWFTEFLLDFLMTLLSSENRCERISAYDMIQSLCLIEDNHETLSKLIQNQFIVKISTQLFVPDIHPLCCALEALVSLSQLGDDMCRRMAMCYSLLKCLLQFVTIEAQMFGPAAIYKVKTFNSRPPVPAVNYNSLRMPVQSTQRALTPFVVNQSGSFIPNTSHNFIRPPTINSISTQSLSNPFPPNPISQYPQNVTFMTQYITNQNNPPLKSQLTPLQQIDHLLTKSIASFSIPTQLSLETKNSTKTDDKVDINVSCTKDEHFDGERENEKASIDRKAVKIKCCVEGVDLEIEDIKGSNSQDNKTLVNGNLNGISNVTHQEERKTELDESHIDDTNTESLSKDKDQTHLYQNGILETELTENEDPDRRQMPPPSLPTPSMLKKQKRPKLWSHIPQNVTSNGYQQQQWDERCGQVKKWLKEKFQITEDVRLFVVKQQLVDELNETLFDSEDLSESEGGHGQKVVLSTQELHSCIKEIFGSKVQVKEAQGSNGNTQLIYSNLARIELVESEKCVTNGCVTRIIEMNGFVHHSTKRKNINSVVDNKVEQKKFCEEACSGDKEIKDELEEDAKLQNIHAMDVVPIKRKLNSFYKTNIWDMARKVKRKYMHSRMKNVRALKSHRKSTVVTNDSCDSIPENKSPLNGPEIIQAFMPCLWGNCTERFINDRCLQSHITNDHLTHVASSNVSSPSRAYCQWRQCPTSDVQRAPLSLLTHVIKEHCTVHYPSQSPQHGPINQSQFNAISPAAINNTSFNTMVSSNPKYGHMAQQHNHTLEKCGWSVLYDHFRSEEQLQPNLPEGPITKHIRISSAIILRNMSRRSIIAKEFLRSHEKYLSLVALNNQDCSAIIVQCLDELSPPLMASSSPSSSSPSTTTPATNHSS